MIGDARTHEDGIGLLARLERRRGQGFAGVVDRDAAEIVRLELNFYGFGCGCDGFEHP